MQDEKLKHLGDRLRQARINRNEMQQRFAERLGVSRPTLSKMESGDPGVTIGLWVRALHLLDRDDEIDQLLAAGDDLFEQNELQNTPKRKRASRKRA